MQLLKSWCTFTYTGVFCKHSHCNLRQTNTFNHTDVHVNWPWFCRSTALKRRKCITSTPNTGPIMFAKLGHTAISLSKNEKTINYFVQHNIYMEHYQGIFSSMLYYNSYKMPLWKVSIFIQAKILINFSTKSTYHVALLLCIFPMRGKYKWQDRTQL